MKCFNALLIVLLLSTFAHAGVDYACFKACKEDRENTENCKDICSTPCSTPSETPPQQVGGGATTNSIGKVMCGPGQCIRDQLGKVWCAASPGGAVTTDSINRIVCVGGCIPGTAEYCKNPGKPRSFSIFD